MDLTASGIDSYWISRGQALHEVLTRMAEVQDWTIDKDLQKWVDALSESLGTARCAAAIAKKPQEAIEFLAWLSSPIALRIINAIDEIELGSAAKLIYQADEMKDNPVYRLFLEGLEVLSRTRLLAHVFSPDRIEFVSAAMKAANSKG